MTSTLSSFSTMPTLLNAFASRSCAKATYCSWMRCLASAIPHPVVRDPFSKDFPCFEGSPKCYDTCIAI